MPIDKITIEGKEYLVKDVPELAKLIEDTRKEEKEKLYSRISTAEAKMKVLEDEKKATGELTTKQEADLEKLKGDLAIAQKEKADLEKAKSKGKSEEEEEEDKSKSKSKGASAEDIAKIVADALAKQAETFDARISEVSKNLGKKTVGDYRAQQLEKFKDVLIPELVSENLDSEEAVNKAIEKALITSKQHIRKEVEVDGKKVSLTLAEIEASTGKEEKDKKEPKDPKTPPNKPDSGSGDLTGKELLSRIDEMSDEEYAKHADAILKEVKSVSYQEGK